MGEGVRQCGNGEGEGDGEGRGGSGKGEADLRKPAEGRCDSLHFLDYDWSICFRKGQSYTELQALSSRTHFFSFMFRLHHSDFPGLGDYSQIVHLASCAPRCLAALRN